MQFSSMWEGIKKYGEDRMGHLSTDSHNQIVVVLFVAFGNCPSFCYHAGE